VYSLRGCGADLARRRTLTSYSCKSVAHRYRANSNRCKNIFKQNGWSCFSRSPICASFSL